jgi:AcrR family transcriptional regulator
MASQLGSRDSDVATGAAIVGPGEPKEGRRERRSRELHDRIYLTARDLFLRNGFEATTVTQISELADIAPATFFNHFRSKGAILREMTAEVFEHLEALVNEQLAAPGSARDRISAFASRVATEILKTRTLAHDVLFELMQIGIHNGDVAPHLVSVFTPIACMLREAQARGEVRTDLDAELLAELVVGALNANIMSWLGDPDYPLADRLCQTASFMGEAIAPRVEG